MSKSLNRIAATVAAVAITAAPWAAHQRSATPPVPQHVCVAEIIPFEDGSWLGGRLLFDGKVVITAPWERVMPQVGWKPGWKGTPCTLTVIN